MRDLAEEVAELFGEVERVEAREHRAATDVYCGHYRAGRWGPWAIPVLPGIVCCLGCGAERPSLSSLRLHKCRRVRAPRPRVIRRKRLDPAIGHLP